MPLLTFPSPNSAATHPTSPRRQTSRSSGTPTVAATRAFPLDAVSEPVENYPTVIDTFDVTFSGYGGYRIKGWLHLPANRAARAALPVVVQWIGYSSGRGLVNQETKWAQAGYAHFIMDTRGQGYGGTLGETPDPHPSAGEVSFAGLMTRGIGRRDCRGGRWVWRPEGSTASWPRCPMSPSLRTSPGLSTSHGGARIRRAPRSWPGTGTGTNRCWTCCATSTALPCRAATVPAMY